MPVFKKIKSFITDIDWINLFRNVYLWSPYIPILVFPWIFSPLSTDPFYNEKIYVLLFFPVISLVSLGVYNVVKKDNKNFVFFYSPLFIYFLLIFIYVFISQILSINFNQSFWGVGSIFCLAILLWIISIYQNYNKRILKLCLVIGISLCAVFNIFVLITRFSGKGVLEIIQANGFSSNGNLLSLLFILFICLYICINETVRGKNKFIYMSGLFVSLFAFILYSYFVNVFFLAVVSLVILLVKFYLPYFPKIGFLKKFRLEKDKNEIFLKTIIIIGAIVVAIFEIFLQQKVLSPVRDAIPINISWSITTKSIFESAKNFFLGIGPNNYSYTYLHYVPVTINSTPFWSQEYTNSIYSITELISNYGLIPFLSIIIYAFFNRSKLRIKDIWKEKKFNKEYLIIFFSILLFIFTPLNIVSIFVLIVTIIIKYKQPQKKELSFYIDKNKSKNFTYLYLSIITVLFLPILIFLFYFFYSSTSISWGYYRNNPNRINETVAFFPFVPKNYEKAINFYDTINSNNEKSTTSSQTLDYAEKINDLNKLDPPSTLDAIHALNSIGNNSVSAANLYYKLLNISPNHIPYLLELSDEEVQQGNYNDAKYLLDEVLSYIPNLDIALVRKANVDYQLSLNDDAKKEAKQVLEISNNNDVKAFAQSLLDNISKVNVNK